jgi:hypothetical protein
LSLYQDRQLISLETKSRGHKLDYHLFVLSSLSSDIDSMASASNPTPAVTLTSNKPIASPDLSLISELFESIERFPPGIEARKLLVEHYMSCGWVDAARDSVSELLSIDPKDSDAQRLRKMLHEKEKALPAPANPPKKNAPRKSIISDAEIKDLNEGRSQQATGYQALISKAKVLHWEMNILRDLFKQKPKSSLSGAEFISMSESNNNAVEALAEGRRDASQNVQSKPGAARIVARQMEQNATRALDIAIQDLTDMAHWLRSTKKQAQQAGELDNDAVREALVKRTQALASSLPPKLQAVATTAQMHIEHEVLQRAYICSETMYGDPVSEIPRERFWVSEDGYPWDMEELAQAITSNGGVMRNPLSRQLFTPGDVKAIIQHPIGKPLAALQLAQSELSKGVRPNTIDQLTNMSAILLGDDSADQMASRHIIDEFLAYVATLPEAEQKALDRLRVPAKDSHTGQPFDSTIGEAVRDAQGNRVCIHKIGDFLGQAVKHLRQN